MTKQEVIEYVMHTPYNTNRAVLRSMLEKLSDGIDVPYIRCKSIGLSTIYDQAPTELKSNFTKKDFTAMVGNGYEVIENEENLTGVIGQHSGIALLGNSVYTYWFDPTPPTFLNFYTPSGTQVIKKVNKYYVSESAPEVIASGLNDSKLKLIGGTGMLTPTAFNYVQPYLHRQYGFLMEKDENKIYIYNTDENFSESGMAIIKSTFVESNNEYVLNTKETLYYVPGQAPIQS